MTLLFLGVFLATSLFAFRAVRAYRILRSFDELTEGASQLLAVALQGMLFVNVCMTLVGCVSLAGLTYTFTTH